MYMYVLSSADDASIITVKSDETMKTNKDFFHSVSVS